jgi:hypothetical protein
LTTANNILEKFKIFQALRRQNSPNYVPLKY